jgi:hypothetical protein
MNQVIQVLRSLSPMNWVELGIAAIWVLVGLALLVMFTTPRRPGARCLPPGGNG